MLAFAEGTSASAVPVITKVSWASCGNHAMLDHSDDAAICSANPLSRGPVAHLAPNSRCMRWDHWLAIPRGPHPDDVREISAAIAAHQLAGLLGVPPRPHDVEARTSLRTLAGMSWANCWATIPPKDRPSTSARSMASSSSRSPRSAAYSRIVRPARRPSIRPFPGVPTLIRSNPSRCRSSGVHVDSDIPIPFSSRIGGPVPLRRTRRCRPSIQAGRSDSVVTWSPAQGSIRTHLRRRDPQRSGLGPPSLPSSTPSMSSATHQHCCPASIVVSILAERSLRRGTSRQPAGPDVQAASVVLAYVRLIQPPVPPRRVMPLSR